MERSGRQQITNMQVSAAISRLRCRIGHAFEKHGRDSFQNSFETLGVLQLEFDEFKKSIQDREPYDRQVDELLDVATVAIIAVAGFIIDDEV